MYPSVKEVIPRDDYALFVVFDNGENGILDMKPILDFGIFQRIKNYEAFRQVRVSFDTIEWDCGVDLDPEFIYAKCKAQVPAWPIAAGDRSFLVLLGLRSLTATFMSLIRRGLKKLRCIWLYGGYGQIRREK